ncbi:MAG: STAS domain-containing protein [Lentisphaeria bacterium]|nr:STAS domain-containing protein [Lentisphaeria bacterium]NQZ66788.1 STAS domain-containing protein [Lentisphaeria bacterium]
MDISRQIEQGICIVNIDIDRLDASNADDFKQEMKAIIEQSKDFIFDLRSLDFIDSTGLGAILTCLRRVTQKSGELKVCNVHKTILTLFELVRFHRIVEIHETVEDALSSYK